MSRVTPPVSKLSRSISSTPAVARPSRLLGGAKVTSDAAGRKRQSKKDDSNLDDASRLLTTNSSTSHRPVPARAPRKVPLMQGFRTSAPASASAAVRPRHDPSRVDNMVLPRLTNDADSIDPYAHVRVPLVWDMSRPAGGVPRAAEQPDGPVMRPEISVVAAAGPAAVLPAALTEVEGMGVDGVELKFVHEQSAAAREDGEQGEQGMIRDIWKGLMDDVFGNQHQHNTSKAAA